MEQLEATAQKLLRLIDDVHEKREFENMDFFLYSLLDVYKRMEPMRKPIPTIESV